MRLGLMNRNVDNSDFKAVDFDCRLRFNLKSNDKSESTIAILIWFRYKIDLFQYKLNLFRYKINLFWYKINVFWSKFDLFWLKDQKRLSKCQLINWKWRFISKMTKTTIFDQIRPIFDINWTIFDINWITFDMSGPDSNCRDHLDAFRWQFWIVKVD